MLKVWIFVSVLCHSIYGQKTMKKKNGFWLSFSECTADGLHETAGPLWKNTTKIFSTRITSLINSWQTEHTGAGITGRTGRIMIYLQTSQLQLTLNPATKGKQTKQNKTKQENIWWLWLSVFLWQPTSFMTHYVMTWALYIEKLSWKML